ESASLAVSVEAALDRIPEAPDHRHHNVPGDGYALLAKAGGSAHYDIRLQVSEWIAPAVQRLLECMVTRSNDDELQNLSCRRVRGHRQAPDAAPAQRRPLRLWQHQVESESRRAALARGG